MVSQATPEPIRWQPPCGACRLQRRTEQRGEVVVRRSVVGEHRRSSADTVCGDGPVRGPGEQSAPALPQSLRISMARRRAATCAIITL